MNKPCSFQSRGQPIAWSSCKSGRRRLKHTILNALFKPPTRDSARSRDPLASSQSSQIVCVRQMALGAVASIAAACMLVFGATPGAHAVTTEQLLFLEGAYVQAWRAVDRAYVDKTFNGQSWFRLREQYLKNENMRERSETYAAIRKLLATLNDPFTRFLEPERYEQLRRGAQGSVTGVGLEVAFSQNAATLGDLLVVAPAEGGPAEKAGVRAGDTLLAIDGVSTKGESLYDVASQLQGEAGSSVTLTIRAATSASSRDVPLTREKVTVQAVSTENCQEVSDSVGASPGAAVGYIRISTFNKQTATAFLEAFEKLKDEGASEFVLDLRNNGGGYFPSGVQVARYLIEQGDIVLIADSKGVKDIYSADSSVEDGRSKLAVLVNRGTASASEVLAGALQDNMRATIVGEPTFGKGLIQTVIPIDPEDDGSAVVVTVARYQTPLGKDINKTGIKPDIPLDDGSLPVGGANVCRALKADEAPRLFN